MWIRSFKNIQVFSRSQEVILKEKVHGKNILMAHLALKDYGESTIEVNKKEERTFRFLFFGNIVTCDNDISFRKHQTIHHSAIRMHSC